MTAPDVPDRTDSHGVADCADSHGVAEAITAAAPHGLQPRVLKQRVCDRAKGMWRLSAVLSNAVVIIVLALAAVFWEPVRPWALMLLAVACGVALIEVLVAPGIRYRVHRWDTTDQAVYARSGWINEHWQVAPFSRIQTVEAKRGPLQRMFRLASVQVTTASATADVTIVGLDAQEASRLVRTLTEATQSTLGDAT